MSRERSKKPKRAGQGGAVPSLNGIEPNAAGIDVGAREIFVLSRRIGILARFAVLRRLPKTCTG